MLLCIAYDPGARLRDIAARTGITGRTAYSILTDLTEAIVKPITIFRAQQERPCRHQDHHAERRDCAQISATMW